MLIFFSLKKRRFSKWKNNNLSIEKKSWLNCDLLKSTYKISLLGGRFLKESLPFFLFLRYLWRRSLKTSLNQVDSVANPTRHEFSIFQIRFTKIQLEYISHSGKDLEQDHSWICYGAITSFKFLSWLRNTLLYMEWSFLWGNT